MQKYILIVDDSQMNREFLSDILGDEYHLLLAENGVQGISLIRQHLTDIAIVLLDLVMPDMNGFEVLEYMNKNNWIQDIPVIMISADTSGVAVEKAYELGASDFIYRPFHVNIVRKRVANIIALFSKQRRLKDILTEQIYEKEKRSALMITILSHIVEFRNGESGLHILHINRITEMLLNVLSFKHPEFKITYHDISLITTASSLHDIGKISIADDILNKPGRLTKEEFEIMKTHSAIGAKIIKELKWDQHDELLKVAYEICRWHHERWDGRGYPDGLKGDEIPLSAQVVALADVYDALISERCYKKAISHDKAIAMICHGECGTFNPLLLECLVDIHEELKKELDDESCGINTVEKMMNLTSEIERFQDLSITQQVVDQLEMEKQKYAFFTEKMTNFSFVYNCVQDMMVMSKRDASRVELPETIIAPLSQGSPLSSEDKETLSRLLECAQMTCADEPEFEFQSVMTMDHITKLCHFVCRSIWHKGTRSQMMGIVGIIDQEVLLDTVCYEKMEQLKELKEKNHHFQLSFVQAKELLQILQKDFAIVRFIDLKTFQAVSLNESQDCCYALWQKQEKCLNCFADHQKACEQGIFATIQNEIYYIIGEFIEIDGQSYLLELGSKVNELILSRYDHQYILQSLKKLKKQLYYDDLTDAYNRRYLEERIYESKDISAIAMIDLDHFKDLNDRYGHHSGDLVLKKAVEAIQHRIREKDAVIRYGGDEFVIMFDDIPANIVAERLNMIKEDIAKIVIKQNQDLNISCSIGGVIGKNLVSKMLVIADKMLYQAKMKRNTVVVKYLEDSKNGLENVL